MRAPPHPSEPIHRQSLPKDWPSFFHLLDWGDLCRHTLDLMGAVTSSAINVIPEMSPSSFSLFGSRIEALTFHPFEANSFAVARPTPKEAPVMKIAFLVLVAHRCHD